ncbi:MAG: hypothetical protein ABL986_17685, partial [Vicinamibacterales bacterium]
RADIWAFGCVLYEVLTGARAFAGDDVTETLANVLKAEPDWSALPTGLSPTVLVFLRRCLQKDSKQRIGDIRDMRLALEGVFDATVLPPQTSPGPVRGRLAWTAAGAVAAAVIVGLAVPMLLRPREAETPLPLETRTEIVTPSTEDPTSFALSPDGTQIVFAASGDGVPRLWLRSLSTTTAQPLTGTEGAATPFWSPDGRAVAFIAGGSLKRLDLAGGIPQVLAAAAPRGGSWGATGVILFTPNTGSPLFRVPASGGRAETVTTLDRQGSHRFPVFLPDGRQFLFLAQGAAAGIYLGALESRQTTLLVPGEGGGVYLPAGWLLWVRAGKLFAQRLDLGKKTLAGEPVTVADFVGVDVISTSTALSVSTTGLIAYRSDGGNRRQAAWFDRSGKLLGTVGPSDESGVIAPRASADSGRIVMHRVVGGNSDIWIADAVRTTRLTFDAAQDRYPIWSPDGRAFAFDSNRKGHRDIFQKASSGAGTDELLVESSEDKYVTDWSADGRFLTFSSSGQQTARDIWVLPITGDRRPWIYLKTAFDERWGVMSPDGRWMAYMSNESGRPEIYVRAFDGRAPDSGAGGGAQWQISAAGGVYPVWRADGKELFFIAPGGEMMAAPIAASGSALVPGAPVMLFRTKVYGGGGNNEQGRQYNVTRDGRFMINTVTDGAASPITLLQNWNPDATK